MHPTRREALRLGLGTSALLACGGASVPTFVARTASAFAEAPRRAHDGRILVVLQLDGGNDGLNTVVPYRDDAYRRLRRRLRLSAKEVRRIDDRVGFHPALGGFSTLLEDGRLALVQGVGYPNPSRSHFESSAVWQTARDAPDGASPGWLARALDRRAQHGGDAPALHIDGQFPLPQALAGGRHTVPTLARLDQLRRRLGVTDPALAGAQRDDLDRLGRQQRGGPGSLLQFVERSALITYASSARLESLAAGTTKGGDYPESFGLARRLRLVAQLIKAGLATSIYYTHLDGFDTHAGQLSTHAGLLRELGDSVRAFLDDLEVAGEADRVVVLVFSEFGRRVAENASAGTDHGTAAPLFLLGRPARAGVHGPYPDLADLDDGDLRHAIDFRRVYATLLGDWLGVPPREVLGGAFDPLTLLRT